MSLLRKGMVAGVSLCTALMLTAVGASASAGGSGALSRFEARLVSAMTAGGLNVNGSVFSSGTSSLGHAFGMAISSLARSIPPGPMHGKLVSSYARHMNPSNFNGSHSQSGQDHGRGSNHASTHGSGANHGQGATHSAAGNH